MPQQTNLNVSPYFDDYNESKDFHKVLFKPGFPVQARELTTLQSILQNQVEKFGSHFFKEGSMVIPGSIGVDSEYYGVKIDSTFFGVPVTSYLEKLVDVEITGATSGVVAKVVKVLDSTRSEQGVNTLYIKYLSSNPTTGQQFFFNGEPLITSSNIIYGSSLIKAGTTFANTVASDASFKGSAVTINDGVYYTRGFFVGVKKQTILVGQYDNKPSARVGLIIDESIVTALDDNSLNDNSQGFSNYSAPGADRLKISLVLFKKNVDDFNDQNFIELVRLNNGIIEKFVDRSQYNLIRNELARRTYDESGDYTIKPFEVFPKETLNNLTGNEGLFYPSQTTPNGNVPSDDLLTYQIMPGKAYVRGYDIETIAPEFIDVKKPRTTVGIPTNSVYIDNGTVIKVNNIFGWPKIGYESLTTVDLRNRRRDLTSGYNQSGITTIGTARVYTLISDNEYQDNTSEFNLYVYDVQTFASVGVNTLGSSGLSIPAYIKGASSNATGYLKYNVNAGETVLTLTNTTGKFIKNENLIINGIKQNYVVTSTYDYGISDTKSVFQNSNLLGLQTSFNADTVLDSAFNLTSTGSDFSITGEESGSTTVGVITASNASFNNVVRVDDIIAYSKPGEGVLTFNRVSQINSSSRELLITGITTVSGICTGSVTLNPLETSNLFVIRPSFETKNFGSFFNRLRHSNISSVDLSLGDIEITYQFTGIDASTGQFSIDLNSHPDFQDQPNVFWKSFSVNNYRLVNSNGVVIPLRSGNILILGKVLYVKDIDLLVSGGGTANSILTCSLDKKVIQSKNKSFSQVQQLIVSRSKYTQSGIGTTTLNNGLIYSPVYGTRVEDDVISLNTCDVFKIYGVYESSNIESPVLPTLTLSEITSSSTTNSEFVVGETIRSFTTSAKAIIVSKIDVDKIEIQYLNETLFTAGEQLVSLSSGITARCTKASLGDKNIISDYYFDNGIRDEYYDYSRILRPGKDNEPKKSLRIVFQSYSVPTGDNGDFFTINSYPADNYQSIPLIPYRDGYIRNSDGIDIRPRVKDYSLLSSRSPFEFDGKDFSETSDNSEFLLSPNTSVEIAYSFYVGRIDKIYLNRDGKFFVSEGTPDIVPKPPTNDDSALEIGTVYLPPYVYNAKTVKFTRTESKRYTMKDISKLEDRISNVEFYTSLSLLESDTNTMTIKDPSTGLDRFKSGFFVDNFKSLSLINSADPNWGCSIDTVAGEARPLHHTPAIDLQLGSSAIPGVASISDETQDLAFVTDLGNPNVKKTGDLLTLNYTEVEFNSQLFATRTENVNPFNIVNWSGSVELYPASDIWIETSKPTVNNISFEGSHQAFMDLYPPEADGWSAIQWNSWEENFAGRTEDRRPLGGAIILDEKVTPSTNWEFGRFDDTRTHITSNGVGAALKAGDIEAANRIVENLNEFGSQGGLTVSTGFVSGNVQVGFFATEESGAGWQEITRTLNRTTTSGQATEVTVNRPFNRSGVSFKVSESIDRQSLGTKVVSREVIPYLRVRNIEFTAKRLKPSTGLYPFLDGVNMSSFVIPKLIEIEMISGVFQSGERVIGIMPEDDPLASGNGVNPRILFRLANPDHKYGPYNNPTEVYTNNPYNPSSAIEQTYSTSSSLLNVDTYSLADITSVGLGWIAQNQRLVGQTSGAEARITNVRLVTDASGSLRGCLFIPDTRIPTNPKFETGTKTFKLTDSVTNSTVGGQTNSSAEASWFASGQLDNLQEDIVSIRNARIEKKDHNDTKVETERREEFRVTENTVQEQEVKWVDPLCQSFVTGNGSGIYVTSIDVFFRTKSASIPITCQIRSLVAGNPTQKIPAFGEISLDPKDVFVSEDGSIPTKFTFPSPVYLPANQEYGITLLANSDEYNVFIARMGEIDVTTVNNDESAQIIVSQQPSAGVLFKSQNGSTWTANQYEDLKYVIHKAKFSTQTGTVRFYSPILSESNSLIRNLRPNPVTMNSRQLKIGVTTGISDSVISSIPIGIGITQDNNTFYGRLVGLGGTIKENDQGIIVNDVGIGITPFSGDGYVYDNVYVTSETGQNARCQIFVKDGTIVSAGVTVISGGNGYQLGQRLSIASTSFAQIGNETPILSVGLLESGRNVLFVDNVQGTFDSNKEIAYVNSSGIAVTFVTQTNNTSDIFPSNVRDGLHMNIKYYGHGMHSNNNIVQIANLRPDIKAIDLLQDISNTSTDIILTSVGNTSLLNDLTVYENISVDSTNPGYIQIGEEIIKYTGFNNSGTGLSGVVRGQFNTVPTSHRVNDKVYKYELNGVSLVRLNNTFRFSQIDIPSKDARDLDNFYVKVAMEGQSSGSTVILADRSGSGSLPRLYFKDSKTDGGFNVKCSKNIQFETIHPNVQVFTPADTSVNAEIRTISATSIGSVQNPNVVDEISFQDNGFEPIVLNENNNLSSPRMIASRVNELEYLNDLPGNRSLTLEINLNTQQEDISPAIDLNRINAILTTNRINNPVQDFVTNGDIMSPFNDPHAGVYVTKPIAIKNPATSLKVMFAANKPPGTDVRVLYKIYRSDGPTNPDYELFPGYSNLTSSQEIIDPNKNDGSSDTFVPNSNFDTEFNDHEFTVNNLPEFRAYAIKVIFTSTNQANVPRLRDFRVIALA
jgi:hypothetical protein